MFGNRVRQTRSPIDSTAEALLLMQGFERSCQGWFWSIDAAGRVVYISDSVAEILSSTTEALVGTGFSDLFVAAEEDSSGRRNPPFMLTKRSAFDGMTLRTADPAIERCWSVSGEPHFWPVGRVPRLSRQRDRCHRPAPLLRACFEAGRL